MQILFTLMVAFMAISYLSDFFSQWEIGRLVWEWSSLRDRSFSLCSSITSLCIQYSAFLESILSILCSYYNWSDKNFIKLSA